MTAPALRPALLFMAIAALAAALYLPGLGRVRAPIWDESYYLPTTARYHEERTQFASHPPLGMMLIAAGDSAFGSNTPAQWHAIAGAESVTAPEMPDGFDYTGVRITPALFGVLGAGLFALVMLELTGSLAASAALSLLYLGDTAIAVEVRAALLDPFQLTFMLGAMLAAIRAIKRPAPAPAFAVGLCLAAAALVRANALVLGVMVPVMLWPTLAARDWTLLARQMGAGMVGALTALGLTLAMFIALTPLPPDPASAAGRADLAFLAPPHRAALDRGHWTPAAVIAVAEDITAQMRGDLAVTPKTDANGSHPVDWLLARGSILYRADAAANPPYALGLTPNRAVWLISLLGVLSSLLPGRLRQNPVRVMLLGGWLASMAALAWLDSQRVVYLYHYLIPLLLGHALAALEWKHHNLPRWPALALAAACLGFALQGWDFAVGLARP